MLTLTNVFYRWPGASEDCLRGLSLQINQGEWLALTGDNGAGKSTLLRLMAGLLSPGAGHITFQGIPLSEMKNQQRAAAIGVLFQEAENQIFHSQVAKEVAFGLHLQKRPAQELEQRTADALALCGLEDVALAHPLDLYIAQRRMVAVASLEALAPPLILLDEPSRDFDEHWLGIFEGWLAACRQRGTTVLAISHDAEFTHRHFPRVVRLQQGLLVNSDNPLQASSPA
ncbi:ABC transporter ATP-binding protein [Superficieibacter electus]|uniref:ABC transporter ATP-binding protein n=1 Tax=Superficieibacter electus TaxID=2022662 RepID=A0A2P5GT22_9ENTR|nr:ATP-binding cassette domain-containing protein [Superficieibacter electus]POP46222.1 ABC transporter ATP-binding protein [Superficieibacter electus]POP49692.1 ABC transporter ATP-binding protein [Superficieibacter electus]